LQLDLTALSEALSPLPGTRQEVLQIAKSLGPEQADLRLGRDASESAVKAASLDAFRIVYFATHGLVAGEVEALSKVGAEPALALSLPSVASDVDDGLLTASEVAQLVLNAEWAVLSACNTAASDSHAAEALSGLARAFIYAGAKSLVVSHWDVSDAATARLMSDVFAINSRDRGLSHGEVLQRAMLNMLGSAQNDEEAHPRMWAPFIVVGEPRKPSR
jgi:CHAT domain-containing protein